MRGKKRAAGPGRPNLGQKTAKRTKIRLALSPSEPYSSRSFYENIMRRPKGIRTRKAVAKRFKITARGKVMRKHAGKRHLLSTKNSKRRRGLGESVEVHSTDTYRITQNLPTSH